MLPVTAVGWSSFAELQHCISLVATLLKTGLNSANNRHTKHQMCCNCLLTTSQMRQRACLVSTASAADRETKLISSHPEAGCS
jgi:hypothetical protein